MSIASSSTFCPSNATTVSNHSAKTTSKLKHINARSMTRQSTTALHQIVSYCQYQVVLNTYKLGPMCNLPIAIKLGQDPNTRMEEHFSKDCTSMTGKSATKSMPTCARGNCKKVLYTPIKCDVGVFDISLLYVLTLSPEMQQGVLRITSIPCRP